MDLNYVKELIEKAEYNQAIDLVANEPGVDAKYLHAISLASLGMINEAIAILTKNKELFDKNDYWHLLYYQSLGRLIWTNGDLDEALDYMLKAQSLLINLSDLQKYGPIEKSMTLESIITMMIGVIYDNKGDFNQALKYGLKALELQKLGNDIRGIIISYHNIGYIYAVRGLYEQSMDYIEKGLKLIDEHGFNESYAMYYQNKASIYANKKLTNKAFDYTLKAIKLLEDMNESGQTLAFSYNLVIQLNVDKENFQEADLYLEKLENYSKKNTAKRIKEIYFASKAYFLKSSKRLSQKAEGEKLFRLILKEPYCRLSLRVWVLKNLLELLLLEYRMTKELEVIDEINYFMHEIEEIAINQQIYKSVIDVSILKSRLATIKGDYHDSLHELDLAKNIAVENNMTYFIELVDQEKAKISKDFKELQKVTTKNKELSEMLQNDELIDYIVDGLKIVK